MLTKYNSIINVEWKAQKLVKEQKKIGPSIEILVKILPNSKSIENDNLSSYSIICIQGSFDPPTLSHIELLRTAIKLQKGISPSKSIYIVVLLSLSHVDKRLNVVNRSLLGYRVEMLVNLFRNLNLNVPVDIALSNVARYIDLIQAVKKRYINITPTFIMGMDVFKKLFDSVYYSQSLEQVLPLIFEANYIVAGRNEIFSKKRFEEFLREKIPQEKNYFPKILFFTLPKSLRFHSSTLFRKKFEDNNVEIHKGLDPIVIDYIKRRNLYKFNLERLTIQIIIQTATQLAMESELEFNHANRLIKILIADIKKNQSIQEEVITEYKQEKYSIIIRKWNELVKSNSSLS